MCGIVGYIGERDAAPILFAGLLDLEMRGYDSAGIKVLGNEVVKCIESPENLRHVLSEDIVGGVGIAHNRWSTQGEANLENAHPHRDCSGKLWLAHNGKIDNWYTLREELLKLGHTFNSKTDTEIIAHLIEEHMNNGLEFERAVTEGLKQIRGTYGVVVVHEDHPDMLFAASMGSPIVVGIGDGEYIVASDPTAIIRHTRDAVMLNDGDCAVLTREGHRIFTLDHVQLLRESQYVEGDIEEVSREGYDHFMMKEMMESPQVLIDSARGRIDVDGGNAVLGGLESVRKRLIGIRRIIIVGCGSAYYAGLYGRCFIEEYAGIPVEVELGSEFKYRNLVLEEGTAVIAVSQSGETADTKFAVREAKRRGLLTLGIVNKVGMEIAREVEAGVYNHAGFEKSVASTKAFMSQIEVFALIGLYLGRLRNLSHVEGRRLAIELEELPTKVAKVLTLSNEIEELAKYFTNARGFLFLGRTYNLPIALEGALKVKEVSYIPSEGIGAGEIKHGPFALIDPAGEIPAVVIAPQDNTYERMVSTVGDIISKKGTVIAVVTEGDTEISRQATHVIEVPSTLEPFTPLLTVVPLQLFAYHLGVARGVNVDKPRNLAKSVTVE